MLKNLFNACPWRRLVDDEHWWDQTWLDGESGIYLLGTATRWWGGGIRHVYVGRSENLRRRLRRHARAESNIRHHIIDAKRSNRVLFKVLLTGPGDAADLEREILGRCCLPWNTVNSACSAR